MIPYQDIPFRGARDRIIDLLFTTPPHQETPDTGLPDARLLEDFAPDQALLIEAARSECGAGLVRPPPPPLLLRPPPPAPLY